MEDNTEKNRGHDELIFSKEKPLSKLSDDDLSARYKKLADQYDIKPTQDLANKMNEIGEEWKKRTKIKAEDPPLEVQRAMHEIAIEEPEPKPEPPIEIIE